MPHMIEPPAGVEPRPLAGYIEFDERKPTLRFVCFQMFQVAARPGDQIIKTDYAVAVTNKTIAKMRSDESGSAGYEMMHGPF
jgi:hypothetical protein